MAFWILCNTVGESSSLTAIEGTTASTVTSAGYSAAKVISGPRSNKWRGNASASRIGLGYKCSASLSARFAVIARADLIFRNQYGIPDLDLRRWNGSAWSTLDSLTGIAVSDLIGIKNQDFVRDFGATTDFGFGLQGQISGGATSSAMMHGPFYFSSGFDFGSNPRLDSVPISQELAGEIEEVRPCFGYGVYSVVADLSLRWENISQAKMAEFRALPLGSPMFLYDPEQNIFHHKLEHVILADPPIEIRHGFDKWSMVVKFRRLEHYDV